MPVVILFVSAGALFEGDFSLWVSLNQANTLIWFEIFTKYVISHANKVSNWGVFSYLSFVLYVRRIFPKTSVSYSLIHTCTSLRVNWVYFLKIRLYSEKRISWKISCPFAWNNSILWHT